MSAPESWRFETTQIHAGAAPDPVTKARATPIYQTTSYVFDNADHAANLFALAEFGNIYTRIQNPTQDVVEQRVAALEGGTAALLLSSGQAASTYAVLNIAQAGDHIVSSSSIYGGTYNLFKYTLAKLGIDVTFVENQDDAEEWRRAVQPNTKLFFAETIGNPKINVLDIRTVADVAHEAGVPLIVDNTIATPYLIRPFEHGADIVVHSATKFLGGHGTVIGGVIVDGGTFRPLVPRRRVHAGGRRPARLRHQGARAAAARPGRRHLAAERVAAHPGHRDAVAAHRASRAECAGDRRVAGEPRRHRVGQLLGPADLALVRRGEPLRAQGRRRGAVVRAQGRRRGGP